MGGVNCAVVRSPCHGYKPGYLSVSIPRVERGDAGLHSSGSFEVSFDRKHNKVGKNMSSEGKLPGSPTSCVVV